MSTGNDGPDSVGSAPDLGRHLWTDVAWLQSKWRLYHGLFGSQESVALLSDLAPGCFDMIQDALLTDVIVSITRLSDPVRSAGRSNLSLSALIARLGENGGLASLLSDFQAACEPVRRHRNRRVAHNDLRACLAPDHDPIPGVSGKQIDRICQLSEQLVREAYSTFSDGDLSFEPVVPAGDASDLLYWLRAGLLQRRATLPSL